MSAEAEQERIRKKLIAVRDALTSLHKTLLDSERIGYVQTFGSVGSTGEFLQLVIRDPWFAWLRPISELIVLIDQALDEDSPVSSDAADALFKTARTLLIATETGDGFSKHYFDALQRDPDVVLAHAGVGRVLNQGRQNRPA